MGLENFFRTHSGILGEKMIELDYSSIPVVGSVKSNTRDIADRGHETLTFDNGVTLDLRVAQLVLSKGPRHFAGSYHKNERGYYSDGATELKPNEASKVVVLGVVKCQYGSSFLFALPQNVPLVNDPKSLTAPLRTISFDYVDKVMIPDT